MLKDVRMFENRIPKHSGNEVLEEEGMLESQ